MVIVDPKYLIDADRYRKINIDARSPAEVYPDEVAMAARNNTDFIRRCASEIDTVEFADRDSGRIYLRLEKAQPVWFDGGVIDIDHADVHIRAAVEAVMSGRRLEHLEGPTQHVRVDTQDAHLLGAAFKQGAAS
jgi:hypothetical protein